MKRSLQWLVLALAGSIVLGVAIVAWSVNTQAGTRWALGVASNVLEGKLRIQRIEGSIAGPLTLTGLRYRDVAAGIDLSAEHLQLDVALLRLFSLTAHVINADLRDIQLALSEPTQPPPPPEERKPFTLQAPLDIILDRLTLSNARVTREGTQVVALTSADFAGRWTEALLAIQQLNVQSPHGEIQFAGSVSEQQTYVGDGKGRFRWQVGTRTYSGALTADARDAQAALRLDLTSPLKAQLKLGLSQQRNTPWNFRLDVPTFDPRESLLPASSLQTLAASLQGEGSIAHAIVRGGIVINGETIHLERWQVTRNDENLDIDTLTRIAQGSVQANGAVLLSKTPVETQLDVRWREVVVPEQWAGQVLHTSGQLDIGGGANDYAAKGSFKLGPPQQLADVQLQLRGTPQRVNLDKFEIRQAAGLLGGTAQIELQPAPAWQIDARAEHFNPGAFAVGWKGDLNFRLASTGVIRDTGPQASLKLDELRGHLRNRPLSGKADLTLDPNRVLAGQLDVRSGRSRLNVEGARGAKLNARLRVEVPALDDWMPNASGSLQGLITAQGAWPDLAIRADVHGENLRVADMGAKTLALDVNVRQPLNPNGSAQLQLHEAEGVGFEFATLAVTLQGSREKHEIAFDATGTPLSTQFAAGGELATEGWSGSVQRLRVDLDQVARLSLQQPVELAYLRNAMRMSEACFADRDIRLCMQADLAADRQLRARYSLRNVPLALMNALAPAGVPVEFAGSIGGDGDIQRTALGELSGRASIESSRAVISRRMEGGLEESQTLLTLEQLRMTADLSGKNATARIAAGLNDSGKLQAQASVSDLGSVSAAVRGDLSANLPSIAVVEAFAPQLANLKGRAELQASVAGTLDAPQIQGELRATDLATDVPGVGLQLRNGGLTVSSQGSDRYAINGSIDSGKGQLSFNGAASTDGIVRIQLRGHDFLAADIPSARVVVAPDLAFSRDAQRMLLTGDMLVSSAAINLQKLPKTARAQSASSDVVVIDAVTQEQAQAQGIPLTAEINVQMGDDVKLAGYGLDAKVDGRLAIRERPGEPTTGSGEVRVGGTYKAYGQDLTIRQGQLLFAGTPLDDPRLSIVAVRVVDEVTAGLRVSGTAKNPQLSVFSDPAMGQSNALSYLVTGKPLDDIGSSEGDGDALQSAARSLGTAAGGLLAKNVGRRLGVDEFGVKDSEVLGGAALTVGQYLSPRLYLSYGVGIFEPGEVITLRYKLTDELALEALNAKQDSRVGVEYRIEK